MSKNTCILNPEAPNGGASRLYKKLMSRFKNRELVNYIYAVYTSNKTADSMDAQGYKRNTQGEHYIEDVIAYLHINEMQAELSKLPDIKASEGIIDSNGHTINYSNAEEALKIADGINNKYKGVSAMVRQHGDVFNIEIFEKNSTSHTYGDSVNEALKAWDIYKQVFNNVGIDITTLPKELNSVINALNVGLGQYLKNLSNTSIDDLYKRDALLLLSLNPNSQHIQNVINAFGSIEEASQAIDDINHGAVNFTDAQKLLLRRAIADAQKFNGIDLNAVIDQVRQVCKDLNTYSPEQEVKRELNRLDKKYHIKSQQIHVFHKNINALSQAAEDAAFVIERQIRKLRKERGNNAEGKKLELLLNKLTQELANKKYYSGILHFFDYASTQVAAIDALLENMPQTGTALEIAFGKAKTLYEVNSIREQYYTLVKALADKNISIDESIPKEDIDNIRQKAQQLKDFFESREQKISELTQSVMTDILMQIVGNTTPDGQAIMNAVTMATSDSTKFDWIYSIGRVSNPIVATAGTIIRNAQDARDGKINAIAERIRKATDRLYKAGYNSEFMYEDDGHLISDIDWKLYESARKKEIQRLAKQGLKGFDFKQALEDWEEQNTEDRIVDNTNGRTEKVPNSTYHKTEDFKKDLSKEQIEYYDTMMQLKGEIGSLLPVYAQKQYLPPQVRRKFLDALSDAKTLSDVGKAVKNKFQNLYTIREDDENYSSNGIIDDNEYEFEFAEGGLDNTPLRQIPIFYINKVEEGELLKNFSTGLQALAGTAINYNAMHEIADVVEFISDFTKSGISKVASNKADVIQTRNVTLVKELWKKTVSSNTSDIMQGMLEQHLYGMKREEVESQWGKRGLKLLDNLIAYTSFKGLATNFKGAFQNYIMGEFQMLIDAGCSEFYGIKDYIWAHTKLLGSTGVEGEMMELLTNNMSHKGVLLRELFDPLQKNFSDKSHKQYHTTWFRQLVGHDCSFIGYSSGEYLIHYVNMYAYLHKRKVLLNGKEISMFDAFEVTPKEDGNSQLKLKDGVTDLKGKPIVDEYKDLVIKSIRGILRELNQTCHGAMNEEDKGIIHRKWWGRAIMNFRQWMPEHYSRRFRSSHMSQALQGTVDEYGNPISAFREGYWTSFYKGAINEDIKDIWNDGHKIKAMKTFLKDLATFEFRAATNWNNLNDMQKYNVKRTLSEFSLYLALIGFSFMLGEPDEHKKEFWRRWFIYQNKRLILDTEAAMPNPRIIQNFLTVLNSPVPSLNTMNSLLYGWYGLFNGDLFDKIKSGDHKGENRYWRNMKKYNLPFFKDFEQIQKMDTDDAIFKAFEDTPSNH